MKTRLRAKADRSFQQLQEQITKALREARGVDLYIVELYDDKAVYEEFGQPGSDSKTWEVPYTLDGDNVTFGDRVEVKREVTYRAVKRVAPDTVEGLAIPYGIDTDGEQFTAKTDLCLDWFGKSGRPTIYDHGLDEPGPTLVGRQVEYEEREDGRWAQAQLVKHHRYRKAIDGLVEQGALGFSSGAMPHLVKVAKSGTIERWPWVELSLTPIPAHPGAMVHYTKAATFLEHLEDADTQLSIAAVKAIAAGLGSETADPGTETLDEKAGRVTAAVDEFRDHARAAAAMRAKAGRVLSTANRERIAKALESREAILAAYEDLAALLDETDPEAAGKSADELWQQLLITEQLDARLHGVEVAMS